jgi:hypothetical protein
LDFISAKLTRVSASAFGVDVPEDDHHRRETRKSPLFLLSLVSDAQEQHSRTGKRFLCCRKSDSPDRIVRRRPCIRGRDLVEKSGKISPRFLWEKREKE